LVFTTAALAATGGSIGTAYYLLNQYKRPLQFWQQMFPIYLHYRLTDLRYSKAAADERQERLQELHNKYARRVLDMILDLRGLFIKIGQVGANREDMLPLEYRREFNVLLDQVPAMAFSKVRGIVEQAMGGRPLEEVFSEFEPQALGAASIGKMIIR
jgi:aarF domain-containing kinase